MRPLRSLATAVMLCLLAARAGAAQQGRVTRDAEVRATPDGNVIATLETGTSWRTGSARGGFTLVTLEGWIDASRLGARRDSFPATINGAGTLRLRAEPSLNARILGVFQAGAGIRVLERRGDWARVRRDGWVLGSALTAVAAAPAPARAATPTPARAATVQPAATPGRPDAARTDEPEQAPVEARDGALRANAAAPLSAAPGTKAIGTLESGAIVEPVARDRGWVRVRVEAWVPESLFVPADADYEGMLTAADLRQDPDGHKGKTVRWTVQVVSVQTADPLRRALAPDEPYLLAMGPAGENAILYLALPPSLVEEARRLAPLAQVTVTARIRNGRSQPTGAPVLDVLTLVKK